jgi:chorismate lyase/3-hydroxybenzoate synthase
MTAAQSRNRDTGPPLSVELAAIPVGDTERPLARCMFGADSSRAVSHPGLRILCDTPVCEIWRTGEATESGQHDQVAWTRDSRLLFGALTLAVSGDDRSVTKEAYRQIFACAQDLDYPHLLRIWNYLPGINEGRGDTERYKRFCAGRADAFDESAFAQGQFPAGTAIGTQSGQPLTIYFLATRAPGRRIENPRQTNAPAYPRQYGPRSPRFCRAMAWPAAGEATLLVSGTASIVGHESRHPGDVEAQCRETWRNLEALRERAGAREASALRVYLRHREDLARVRRLIANAVAADTPVIYLQADICRAELVVEIEGVYTIPRELEP